MKSFFFIIFFLIVSTVQAGTINLELQANVSLSAEKLEGTLTFRNSGNQAAFKPTTLIEYKEQKQRIAGKEFLSPQESYQVNFSLDAKNLQLAGSYLFAAKLSYLDEAGYKFTLPFLIKANNKEESRSGVRLTAKDIDYSNDHSSEITIENLEDAVKEINLNYYNAMEIEFFPKVSRLTLGPKETRIIKQHVEAKNLWPNFYANYVVAEYQVENKHFTTSAQIKLIVKEKDKSSIEKTQRIVDCWILLLIISLGVAVFYKKVALC